VLYIFAMEPFSVMKTPKDELRVGTYKISFGSVIFISFVYPS